MDRHSFRDVWFSLAGARERQTLQWQHTLAVAQAIYNWGGPRGARFRPHPLDHMFKKMFPEWGQYRRPPMTLEEYHERMKEHDRSVAERAKKKDADA